MTLYENVLTALVLLGLFVLIYCKYSQKTFGEFIIEMKDAAIGGAEEVQEINPIK